MINYGLINKIGDGFSLYQKTCLLMNHIFSHRSSTVTIYCPGLWLYCVAAEFAEYWYGEHSSAVGRALSEPIREQLQSAELSEWHTTTVAARTAGVRGNDAAAGHCSKHHGDVTDCS